MLAKLTSKNQLTLPKSVTDSLGPVQYFEVQLQAGQIVLTPVRIQRGDAVRAKLAELELGDEVLNQALSWAGDAPKPAKASSPRAAGKTVKTVKVAKLDSSSTKRASKTSKAKASTKTSAKTAVASTVKRPTKVAAKAAPSRTARRSA